MAIDSDDGFVPDLGLKTTLGEIVQEPEADALAVRDALVIHGKGRGDFLRPDLDAEAPFAIELARHGSEIDVEVNVSGIWFLDQDRRILKNKKQHSRDNDKRRHIESPTSEGSRSLHVMGYWSSS